MNQKKAIKTAVLILCVMALVATTFLATVAYFTSKDAVSNTFAVGKVTITLDEGKLNEDGFTCDKATRVQTNSYKLIPDGEYEKDPILHVGEGSEKSWLFVKVENGIAAIEDPDSTKIADQIEANGWTALEGVDGVYYCIYDGTKDDFEIFESFKIDPAVTGEILNDYEGATLNVTGYAIQYQSFENNPQSAWTAVSGN